MSYIDLAMKHNLLPQFKGQITPAQAAGGIKASIENALQLLSAAELLLQHEMWPLASALAILAIEEAGKTPILRRLLIAQSDDEIKDTWREYRSHVNKNLAWILPQLVAQGAHRLDQFGPIFSQDIDHASLLETVKQISIYTDCYGDCHWSIPDEVMDEHFSKSLVSTARSLVPAEPGAMTSQAELEIWTKHMFPVWKRSAEEMQTALLACYNEAAEKGVLRGKHTPADMAEFMGLDPTHP